jgi:hypothetical protein
MAETHRLGARYMIPATLVWAVAWTALAQESIPVPEASTSFSGNTVVESGLSRPFLFVVDPSLPAPGHVIASTGLGNVTRTGEARPVGTGSLLPTASAEVGVLSRLSLYAEGEFAFDSGSTTPPSNFGVEVGAHILLTDPQSRTVRLAMQAGLGRDLSAATKLLVNATLAWDVERLRLAASLTGFHDFGVGTDHVDLNGAVAASYLLPGNFRIGGELVAQDLEELGAARAEGGTSAFAGPSLGWELLRRFEIVVGPAFGLTVGSPRALVRGAASFLF